MNRFVVKVKADNCPNSVLIPMSPTDWGSELFSIPKSGVRGIESKKYPIPRDEPMIVEGDEIWICTVQPGGIMVKAKGSVRKLYA